ncbi:MAG: hypothetical protein GXX79_05730 [Actinomycetales bacterium]|nr:hypothetical protein [Actinomycetales bacterium]
MRVPVDPGDAAPFVTRRDLLFDYGGVDLTEVNPADGLLPALGAVLPAAIALGVPVSAPVFDSAFAEAAPRIAEAFRSMYRGFAPGGFNLIGPHATISHLFTAVDKAVLLYSGGLNSATSLLRYAPDVECLLGVWGVDSDPEDAEVWRMFRSTIAAAPVRRSAHRVLASTNVREVIDERRLNRRFDAALGGLDWWTGAQYGMTLTTMAAPLCAAFSLGAVIIGSPHPVDREGPWGSTPELDATIRWSVARVLHDAMEYGRQDKIREIIVPWLWQGNDLPLAVCHEFSRRRGNVNCGVCERCMRAVSGFLAAGQDPARVGLPVSAQSLRAWQDRLAGRHERLGPEELVMWREIQQSIDLGSRQLLDVYGAGEYLSWLARFDLSVVARGRGRARDDSSSPGYGRRQQRFNPLRRRGGN